MLTNIIIYLAPEKVVLNKLYLTPTLLVKLPIPLISASMIKAKIKLYSIAVAPCAFFKKR